MWGWIVAAIVSTFLATTVFLLDVKLTATEGEIQRGWFEHKGKVYIITPGEVK